MIIKSVKLKNIRSYKEHKINFPEGSILLAGDIGSGKSSILLAIEFALFGVRRKSLSGGALLRNGENDGFVELNFEVDGRDVIIKRTLKKGKNKVEQTAGEITIDGVRREATAIELKASIVNLLGYPKEIITKSKNLIYRYTVYTPQEEMKQILIEDGDERLDTLRKVFGIDKYKKIRENCVFAIRNLKDKRKEIEFKIADLEYKKKEKTGKLDEIRNLNEKIEILIPQIESIQKQIVDKKFLMEKFEKNVEELYRLKKEKEVRDISSRDKTQQKERNVANINNFEKEIEVLKNEILGKEAKDFKIEIKEKEELISLEERKLREVSDKISEFKVRKLHSEEVKNKINNLEKCPTCEQNVSLEHKKSVIIREDESIGKIDIMMKDYSSRISVCDNNIRTFKTELEVLRTNDNEASLILLRKRNIDEKERNKIELIGVNKNLEKEINEINIIKSELNKKIEVFSEFDDQFKQLKLELESVERDGKRLEIEKAGYETEKRGMEKFILTIDAEILEKENRKKQLVYIGEMQNWLEEGFIKLMTVMEKHVMTNIFYAEFNDFFQKWFNLLIEDEALNVRLDDDFTPVVNQNGYDVEIFYLSGGERTAAALAYRLALNRVVNDLMVGIKTKDLIILDEPTDGFSTEQLDRVRDVLNEIGTRQTILVSHESKIESFVDHVIRINKNEHISEIS